MHLSLTRVGRMAEDKTWTYMTVKTGTARVPQDTGPWDTGLGDICGERLHEICSESYAPRKFP